MSFKETRIYSDHFEITIPYFLRINSEEKIIGFLRPGIRSPGDGDRRYRIPENLQKKIPKIPENPQKKIPEKSPIPGMGIRDFFVGWDIPPKSQLWPGIIQKFLIVN